MQLSTTVAATSRSTQATGISGICEQKWAGQHSENSVLFHTSVACVVKFKIYSIILNLCFVMIAVLPSFLQTGDQTPFE